MNGWAMQTQHTPNVPQQYARFVVAGTLMFSLIFYLAAALLMPHADARRDLEALKLLGTALVHVHSFSLWLRDIETGYLPFFLRQRPLVESYALATACAWWGAYIFDTKIYRKEKTL